VPRGVSFPPPANDDRGAHAADRLAGVALWLLLVGLSTRLLVSAWQRHVLLTDESPLLYHAATLGFNYVDFGFRPPRPRRHAAPPVR
jgi:hypothetical protein